MYKVGEIHNNFEIVKIIPVSNNNKYLKYECKCLSCKSVTVKYHSNVTSRGCGVCSNKVVIKGINDSLTTNPELEKYVVYREEYENNSFGSANKVHAKCPNCGNIKKIALFNLCKNGLGCPMCSDGISFPNKFMFNLLKQCNIEFENEKIFEWSNGKIYDIYIKSLSMIIENHGGQHYKNGFYTLGGNDLKNTLLNDSLKKQLALNNNISRYITIDCRISSLEYIKQSIIQSGLLEIINVNTNEINWNDCLEFASKNLIKEVAHLFKNNENISTSEIGSKFGISKQTIIHYLKTATKLGWCNYEPKKEMKRIGTMNGHNKSKRVICYEHSETIYDNAINCKNDLNKKYNYGLDENNMRNNCRYKQTHHKNLHFFYYDDMIEKDLRCTKVNIATTGKYKGIMGSITCNYFDNTVDVGSGFNDSQREYFAKYPEEIIGKIVSVKYKEETQNKDGGKSLQFPVYMGILIDRDKAIDE